MQENPTELSAAMHEALELFTVFELREVGGDTIHVAVAVRIFQEATRLRFECYGLDESESELGLRLAEEKVAAALDNAAEEKIIGESADLQATCRMLALLLAFDKRAAGSWHQSNEAGFWKKWEVKLLKEWMPWGKFSFIITLAQELKVDHGQLRRLPELIGVA